MAAASDGSMKKQLSFKSVKGPARASRVPSMSLSVAEMSVAAARSRPAPGARSRRVSQLETASDCEQPVHAAPKSRLVSQLGEDEVVWAAARPGGSGLPHRKASTTEGGGLVRRTSKTEGGGGDARRPSKSMAALPAGAKANAFVLNFFAELRLRAVAEGLVPRGGRGGDGGERPAPAEGGAEAEVEYEGREGPAAPASARQRATPREASEGRFRPGDLAPGDPLSASLAAPARPSPRGASPRRLSPAGVAWSPLSFLAGSGAAAAVPVPWAVPAVRLPGPEEDAAPSAGVTYAATPLAMSLAAGWSPAATVAVAPHGPRDSPAAAVLGRLASGAPFVPPAACDPALQLPGLAPEALVARVLAPATPEPRGLEPGPASFLSAVLHPPSPPPLSPGRPAAHPALLSPRPHLPPAAGAGAPPPAAGGSLLAAPSLVDHLVTPPRPRPRPPQPFGAYAVLGRPSPHHDARHPSPPKPLPPALAALDHGHPFDRTASPRHLLPLRHAPRPHGLPVPSPFQSPARAEVRSRSNGRLPDHAHAGHSSGPPLARREAGLDAPRAERVKSRAREAPPLRRSEGAAPPSGSFLRFLDHRTGTPTAAGRFP